MGCCGSCGTRIAFLCIAIWSIVQSLAYITGSVIGMQVFNCEIDMTGTQIKYFIYLLYFRHSQCGQDHIDWNALQIYPAPEAEIPLPVVTDTVERTQIILLTYLISSILWIVASIMIIVGVFCPCMGRSTLRFFSYPWVIVCFLILIQDAVATYYHVVDIIDTKDVMSLINFLEIPYNTDYYFYFSAIPKHILFIPGLMMSLLSSRGVIVWFINLSTLFYMSMAIRRLSKEAHTPEIVGNQQVQPVNTATVTTTQQQQVYPVQNPIVQPVQHQNLQQQSVYPSLMNIEAGPSKSAY